MNTIKLSQNITNLIKLTIAEQQLEQLLQQLFCSFQNFLLADYPLQGLRGQA